MRRLIFTLLLAIAEGQLAIKQWSAVSAPQAALLLHQVCGCHLQWSAASASPSATPLANAWLLNGQSSVAQGCKGPTKRYAERSMVSTTSVWVVAILLSRDGVGNPGTGVLVIAGQMRLFATN